RVAADLGVEAVVVDDVVAVQAARPGPQGGGGVAVRHAEGVEIGDQLAGGTEGEAGVEMEAGGGLRQAPPPRPPGGGLAPQRLDQLRGAHEAHPTPARETKLRRLVTCTKAANRMPDSAVARANCACRRRRRRR